MLYTSVLDPIFDPACNNGQGDINEVGTEECRSNPTNQPARYNLVASPEESSCIFPFQLDGQEYNKCILQAWVYIFKDLLIGGGAHSKSSEKLFSVADGSWPLSNMS